MKKSELRQIIKEETTKEWLNQELIGQTVKHVFGGGGGILILIFDNGKEMRITSKRGFINTTIK